MSTVHLILRYSHIAAGLVTLVAGAGAMIFAKGSPLHRRSGNAFFVAMLVLSVAGVILAIKDGPNMGTAMGGLTAFYMVITAWGTVIRPAGRIGRFEYIAALTGMVIASGALTMAILADLSPKGALFGYLPIMYYVFAAVIGLATLLDVRMIRRGGLTGAARTTRHLWRMCLAFFMATGSFFFGQPAFVPTVLKETGLNIVFGLAPIALMLFWLVRVRVWPLVRRSRPVGAVAAQ